jgi:hypothetical protein
VEAGEGCIMRSFIICTLHQIKEDEMGGAYSKQETDER